MEAYIEKSGTRYTFYKVDKAETQFVDGFNYNVTFSADYIPPVRQNILLDKNIAVLQRRFLQCQTLIYESLEWNIDVKRLNCTSVVKTYINKN